MIHSICEEDIVWKNGRSDSILVYSLFCMYISMISNVVVVTVSYTTILKGDVVITTAVSRSPFSGVADNNKFFCGWQKMGVY